MTTETISDAAEMIDVEITTINIPCITCKMEKEAYELYKHSRNGEFHGFIPVLVTMGNQPPRERLIQVQHIVCIDPV